ncbi:dual specificity protein phosphatase 3-like [Babylonia areolata]|uniref:dual specificity protein phosphatase 3-like n=1 Tax=Babylonia areolata TaxID=304850 RepID=UPI003FCF03E6
MASACGGEGEGEDKAPPCTPEELEAIITAPTGGMLLEPSTAYDEIVPGLFIGEGDSAQKLVLMGNLGVTHVLNAAVGNTKYHVNTNVEKYKKHNISFMGIEATDFMNFDLSPFFGQAADYIADSLKEGKVFVHCVQGVSRSASLVIAYLMLKHRMTVQTATRLVRTRREICPNPGFLQQLCDLDQSLREAGHFASPCSACDVCSNL